MRRRGAFCEACSRGALSYSYTEGNISYGGVRFTAEEKLDAPVKNGETAGEIRYTMGGEVILEGKIVACKEVKEMNLSAA